MTMRGARSVSAVLTGLLLAAVSLAQEMPAPRKTAGPGLPIKSTPNHSAPNFGTSDLTYVRANGTEFTPYNGGSWGGLGGSLSRYPATDLSLDAGIHVPSGAIVDYLELDYYDSSAAADLSVTLLDCGPQGAACVGVPGSALASSGSAGFGVVSASGLNYPVTNGANSLDAELLFFVNDGSLAVTGVVVGYRLQVSPAPVTPTFTDVPTDSIYYQFIEALAASGVTGGCDPGLYCPDRAITRAEMAVFLAKALGMHFPN